MIPVTRKLLVVEDSPEFRDPLVQFLRTPPPDIAGAASIGPFVVEEASCGSEAKSLLRQAEAVGSPFDCVLLDLGLPEDLQDPGEDQEVGFEILEHEITRASCLSLIVLTRYTDPDNFVRALAHGADQFLDKTEGDPKVYSAVVALCRKASAQQEAHWLDYQSIRRSRWLLTASAVQQADRLSSAIVDGLSHINDGIGIVARLMEEQFLVSIDSEHSRAGKAVADLRHTFQQVVAQCTDARGALNIDNDDFADVKLADIIRRAIDALRPGFAFRRVRVESVLPENLRALASPSQIQSVVEEVLFGAIESSVEGSAVRVELLRTTASIKLKIVDTGKQINKTVIEAIETGKPVDPMSGRGWGLSLARVVARRFGTRLDVYAQDKGNCITLAFPVTDDDDSNHRRQ